MHHYNRLMILKTIPGFLNFPRDVVHKFFFSILYINLNISVRNHIAAAVIMESAWNDESRTRTLQLGRIRGYLKENENDRRVRKQADISNIFVSEKTDVVEITNDDILIKIMLFKRKYLCFLSLAERIWTHSRLALLTIIINFNFGARAAKI